MNTEDQRLKRHKSEFMDVSGSVKVLSERQCEVTYLLIMCLTAG